MRSSWCGQEGFRCGYAVWYVMYAHCRFSFPLWHFDEGTESFFMKKSFFFPSAADRRRFTDSSLAFSGELKNYRSTSLGEERRGEERRTRTVKLMHGMKTCAQNASASQWPDLDQYWHKRYATGNHPKFISAFATVCNSNTKYTWICEVGGDTSSSIEILKYDKVIYSVKHNIYIYVTSITHTQTHVSNHSAKKSDSDTE